MQNTTENMAFWTDRGTQIFKGLPEGGIPDLENNSINDQARLEIRQLERVPPVPGE
jgi:hypothetical protein